MEIQLESRRDGSYEPNNVIDLGNLPHAYPFRQFLWYKPGVLSCALLSTYTLGEVQSTNCKLQIIWFRSPFRSKHVDRYSVFR